MIVGMLFGLMVIALNYLWCENKKHKVREFNDNILKLKAKRPDINIRLESNVKVCNYYVEYMCDNILNREFYTNINKAKRKMEELKKSGIPSRFDLFSEYNIK